MATKNRTKKAPNGAEKLILEYRVNRDQKMLEQIFAEYLPLIRVISSKIVARLSSNIERIDLIQDGVIGLFDAIEKFDPTREIPFATYAEFRIRGAIFDSLREQNGIPRYSQSMLNKIGKVISQLKLDEERPDVAKIAKELGITEEKCRELLDQLQCSKMTSLSPVDDSDPLNSLQSSDEDLLANPKDVRQELIERQKTDALERALETLSQKQQQIIRMYFWDEMTLLQISKKLGCDESNIHHRIKFIKKQLAAGLEQENI